MQTSYLKIIITVFLLNASLYSADSTKKENDDWLIKGISESIGIYIHSSGDGADRTNNGHTVRQELSLKTKGNLGDAKAGAELRARATDDKRISKESSELLYLRAYYNTKYYDVQIGDVAQTYNSLVFGGAVKGATIDIRQELDKDSFINYSAIAGVQTASWNELTQHRNNFRDTVAGNIEYKHAKSQEISLSASFAKDRPSSAEKIASPNLIVAQATTVGLDWNWRFNRYVKTKGEIAQTYTRDTETSKIKNAFAGKITIYTKPTRTINSDFKYERYSPDYDSVVGSSTNDRERLSNTTTWSISQALRARMTLKSSRDNLDGNTTDGTLRTHDGLVSLTYRPEFLKRGDIGVRVQQVNRFGRGNDTKQVNAGIDFNNNHKNGLRYGLSYEIADLTSKDDSNASNKLQTLRARLGYKKRFDEDNNFRVTIKADMSFYDEKTDDQKRYGGSIDMGWDYKKYLMFDLLASSKNTDRDLNLDTNYEVYQFIALYKPFSDNSHVLKLNLQRRNYDGGEYDKVYQQDEARLSYKIVF